MFKPFSSNQILARSMLIALVCVGASACSSKEKAEPAAQDKPAAAQTVAAASTAAAPSADEGDQSSDDVQDKVNVYVDCYNGTNEAARSSLERYGSWVSDLDVGPTGKERNVYGTYELPASRVKDCEDQVAKAAKMKPSMPGMENAATQYVEALGALAQTVNEAHAYYSRENYKDDGFAKGKELNKPLVEKGQAFDKASDLFSSVLDKTTDELSAAKLERIAKQDGHNMSYFHLAMTIDSKRLVALLDEETFDVDAAGKRLESFEKLADDMAAYKGSTPSGWSHYLSEVEGFRKAAKNRYRRVRDKVPYSTGEKMNLGGASEWMVDGSPGQLINRYNDLVRSSNDLE